MICVYDIGNTDYAGNGDAVLMPVKCSHRQAAAGKYDLTIIHPMDKTEKWTHLVPEAIIRAPVPVETIETAFSGLDVDVYVTTEAAVLRSGPNAPQTLTYGAWSSGTTYSVGSKVTYNNRNYECTYFDEASGYIMVPPPNSPWWTEIARYIPGDPELVKLKAGTEIYYISGPTDGWYVMSTPYGIEGYIQAIYVEYSHHLTPEQTQPRKVTTQLFRIRTVAVETKTNRVTATAEHVSYDMSGILVRNADIKEKLPAVAMNIIENNFFIEYAGTIATNLTSTDDGTYTGKIQGKNATYALLDPDKGMVSTFDAMYRRDNWDVFVMRKTNTDRGFRLRYGKNIVGVNWKIRTDDLVTRVVPVAKAEDGSELYLDNNGVEWVDSEHISEYPVIRMERLKVEGQVGKDDGTETATNWTETTLRAEMQKKAEERFSVDKADMPVHEITIDFEMMGDTEEYRALKGLENVLLYDKVIAIHELAKMSVTVEVSEIEFDCIREKVTALKMTNVNAYNVKNVNGFNVFNNSITKDKLTDAVSDEISADAVSEAAGYTNAQISNLNYMLRNWVSANFVPQ